MLIVRFIDSNNGPNLPDYQLSGALDYYQIKKTLREEPYLAKKRLKLIYNGRVINDQFDFNDIKYIDHKAYIHCVIGQPLTSEELDKENKSDSQTQPDEAPQVIGFDRLLQQGFSQEDVNDLRAQFETIYNIDHNRGAIDDLEEEERRINYIRQLEERWIDLTVNEGGENRSPPTAPTDPTSGMAIDSPHTVPELEENHNNDLLLGLLIGVFLGVLAVIFLVADDSVFNKRQKMAIIAGLFINISIAIVRGQWI